VYVYFKQQKCMFTEHCDRGGDAGCAATI